MTPEALRDALNCCALAVSEATSGHPAQAMTEWLAARDAAGRAFTDGTAQASALAVILAASAPSLDGEPWRADLWRALDNASLACMIAEDGDTGLADLALMDASELAAPVPCRAALAVVLTAIWDSSRNGVPA